MLHARLDGARSVLCVGAHPDDIEIGCGGTILRWRSEWTELEVHWIVLSGSGARADEARRGAAVFLGESAASVEVADFRDASFPWQGEAIKERFRRLANELDPDVIFTHRLEDRHQDHRLVAELTWQTFRDHLILEYEIPKYEGDLGRPSVYVSLDDRTAEAKVDAIMETFETQRSKPWFDPATFRGLMRLRGVESAAPHGWAEAFTARKLVL